MFRPWVHFWQYKVALADSPPAAVDLRPNAHVRRGEVTVRRWCLVLLIVEEAGGTAKTSGDGRECEREMSTTNAS